MEWHNFETCPPPKPEPGQFRDYLCKVAGVKFLEHAVFRYDGEYWWSFIPAGGTSGNNFEGGWCGLPRGAKITYWAFIEPL